MIKLFQEKRIEDEFSANDQRIVDAINSIHENNLYSENIEFEVARMETNFQINLPIVHFDKKANSTSIEERDIRSFPADMAMFSRTNSVPVAVVKYTIPYTGSKNLFYCLPTQYTNWTYHANVDNNEIVFLIWTHYANVELSDEWIRMVKNEMQRVCDKINENLQSLKKQCDGYKGSSNNT